MVRVRARVRTRAKFTQADCKPPRGQLLPPEEAPPTSHVQFGLKSALNQRGIDKGGSTHLALEMLSGGSSAVFPPWAELAAMASAIPVAALRIA